MYIPEHFRVTDEDALARFIDRYAFGTLVTSDAGRPFASHVPFLHDRGRGVLHAHLARANPQWRHFASSAEALAIFQGPHGYISPTWYAEPGVPTWNYTAVHVYGSARTIEDRDATAVHVEALAARYERGNEKPWVPDYDPRRLGGIVAIEIRITEIQGKFKLSQNRSAADRAGVVAGLDAAGTPEALELARLVQTAG
jgi:transcriptional regulator